MGRKKRHKLVSALVLGVLAISLAICEFRGVLMMPSVTPSITRKTLLTRRELLSPSISPLPDRGLSSSYQIIPPVHSIGAPDQSPTTKAAPPPHVVQSPNVPTVAVPSSPPITPIPTSSPESSPPLVNPPPLVAPSPIISHVLPPGQSTQPIEHAFSPTSIPSPPNHENHSNHDVVASPPSKERLTHTNQNYSHVAPSPMVSQHVQSSHPKVASPPRVPAGLSPSSTKGTVIVNVFRLGHAFSPTGAGIPNTPVALSPLGTPTRLSHSNSSRGRVAAPSISNDVTSHALPPNDSHDNTNGPLISPATHKGKNATHILYKPRTSHAVSPTGSALPVIASSPAPAVPFHQRQGESSSSLAPSAPPVPPKNRQHKHHAIHTPTPGASHPPALAPIALPKTIRALPPPPPNQYCTPLSCPDPYTNSPPGSPCMCVVPIKVGLHLSVSLYKFFNLVSDLAQEIASGVKMKQSQVRVMGANAATEDPDKTVVLVDLVPLGEKFDNITALLVFDKFWHKEVYINPLNFGDYVVLYVIYPGLPPSPPVAPDGDMGIGNKGNPAHPLAADISKQRAKQKAGIIAIIVLSSVFALILFSGAAWCVIFKLRYGSHPPGHTPSSLTKASGTGAPFLTSQPSSITASFNSNMVTYKGTARTFTLFEMERATNGFDESRLIGEGGFGRVYEGILGDGKRVAVKVLKRDDQQGSREFMAEVEMLSRLHHRNLICLIGICTQEHFRSLVYELVPNGSVESHLYGPDKETGPLDWDARTFCIGFPFEKVKISCL
ncbi:receptor-like serine/threonine-protein kinase ALE2 [Carex littledalei]|uniref:Receptor-like serine/threonine-protein kinase ALE2 n=1 Tax=Carex littledalei TaxID=544730 RepID=A0A833VIJ5_9POAL|nr:receptor-like serine/threonine-protein kinase ALE2 [Carex littledalei]